MFADSVCTKYWHKSRNFMVGDRDSIDEKDLIFKLKLN